MPFNRKSSLFTRGASTVSRGYNRPINQSRHSLGTAIRRHEYLAGQPDAVPAGWGTGTLASGEYFATKICAFHRSFGAGTDDEPTATAGNNFQTPDVMNGSKIINLNSTITLKNQAASNPATLTVYEMALSYYDATVWQTLQPSTSIVSQTTGAANAGEVALSAVNATDMLENNQKNSKFAQHYIRPIGTITLGNTDNASSTAVMNVNVIPPKCRRSNAGMMFAYVFVNDPDKNNSGTVNLEYSFENNFDEIPSSNRLPWLA